MRNRFVSLVFVGAAMLAFSPVVLAQTAQQSGAAKATPDLSGIWRGTAGGQRGLAIEEPSMQPWAEERYKAARQGRGPNVQGRDEMDLFLPPYCMPFGMPRVYDYTDNLLFEIIQIPGRVYMLFEVNNQARRIYTDGRKHPEGAPPTFMGHSLGRWDGDTLLVETVDLNDLTWIDWLGHPHSDALRVEERIRRVADKLEIDFLFEDPKAYTKPWRGKKVFELRPDWEMMEHHVCEDSSREEYLRKVLGGNKGP